jgi:hypothetical protein
MQTLEGQLAQGDLLNLIAPFETGEGLRGPDLSRPRPDLRTVPGKLSGSPHVVVTRVETRALASLADDGFDEDGIVQLYPFLTTEVLCEVRLEVLIANGSAEAPSAVRSRPELP